MSRKIRRVLRFANKMVVLLIILALQGAGLYAFYLQQDTLANFKLSYATKIYYPSYTYRLTQFISRSENYVDEKFFASPPTHAGQAPKTAVSVPVLLYHGVLEKSDGANPDLDHFRDQMFALKEAGYQTISDQDFLDFIQGKKTVPEKSFLLTFDDGRKDSFYPVDPILKALDYRATMFVITNRIEKRQKFHLSLKELIRMNDSGHWDFQSHGRNDHDPYQIAANGTKGRFLPNKIWSTEFGRFETTQEYTARLQTDLIASKYDIENLFHRSVFAFAYPFGDYGQNDTNFSLAQTVIVNQVKSVYPLAFFQLWLGNGNSYNYPNHDTFMIKRLEVRPNWDGHTLVNLLNNGKQKDLPFMDDFGHDVGWMQNWSKIDLIQDGLQFRAEDGAEGAGAFLDGTYLWKDYTYTTHIHSFTGTTISLIAKVQDPNHLTACHFTGTSVRIGEQNGTKDRIIAESEELPQAIKSGDTLTIKLRGKDVECMVNGKSVVKTSATTTSYDHGGIGLKVWDNQPNKATLVIDNVTVSTTQ